MSSLAVSGTIAGLRAKRRLDEATAAAARSAERLSSGLRINRASDDAAGLAVASGLNASARVYSQGIRNISDGQSLLAIADSTLGDLSSVVTRIRELAEQSASGTLSNQQRKSLDLEAQQLSEEFSRITRSTTFNGMHIFDGSLAGGLRVQSGFGVNGSVQSKLGGQLGSGAFQSTSAYTDPTASEAHALAFGDLNRDGITDIVSTANNGVAGKVQVRLGNGDGTFRTAVNYTGEPDTSNALALGDINNDGILDVVSGGGGGGTGYGNTNVRLGNGDGTFKAATTYLMDDTGTNAVNLADLNGDGKLDLVTAGGSLSAGSVTVRLGNGNGTFGTASTTIAGDLYSTALNITDLNHDGKLDFVRFGGEGKVVTALGRGDGTFASLTETAHGSGGSDALAIGDINGDGNTDIVVGVDATSISVQLGRTDGTFGSATLIGNTGAYFDGLSLGDINGDGSLDLLSHGTDGTVDIRLGNGDGTFQSATTTSVNKGGKRVGLADLNGDGVLDLVASGLNASGAVVSVLLDPTRSGINSLLSFSLRTQSDSLQALAMLDRKLSGLSSQRGTIGAFQSRLEAALQTTRATQENYVAASSRISDTDIASESAELTRTQILKNTGAAILGQANQLPSLALILLRQ